MPLVCVSCGSPFILYRISGLCAECEDVIDLDEEEWLKVSEELALKEAEENDHFH